MPYTRQLPDSRPASGYHIHIVGCSPRSGTTLLQELMVSSFRIDEFCAHEQSVLRSPRHPSNIVCTKHPGEIELMPCTLRHNSRLHAIYVLRDPRDVIVSRHGHRPDMYYSNLRVWKAADHTARKLGDHPRFLVVRYEDLVRDPDRIQLEIARRFTFLEMTRGFSQFGEEQDVSEESKIALNGVRPVDEDSIGRWQSARARVASQIARHGSISDRLIELGYERDRNWESSLPKDFVDRPSLIPDDVSLANQLRLKWRHSRRCVKYVLHGLRSPTS